MKRHVIMFIRFYVALKYNLKMALFSTGCYIFKTFTSKLTNPGFMIPSTVNCQVRNAARKGYREKKVKKRLDEKKKAMEDSLTKDKQQWKLRARHQVVRKTTDKKKPDPPKDDVFIIRDFNYKKYTLAEAIQFHKEYHHPTVFNNPEAPISVRFDIDMTGKKETQVIKPFSGLAAIKHPFIIKLVKEVLVFCQPEDVPMCLECGASVAGGADLVKKIQDGIILLSAYDHVIAHSSVFPELVPIRGLLKDKLPRLKKGNLTSDLKSAIPRFLHGIEYNCIKYECDHNFGIISTDIGKVDMPTEHIEENFKDVLEDILKHRPSEERDFITWVWCLSPPSDESFSLDLSKYLPQVTKSKADTRSEKVKERKKPEKVEKEEKDQIEMEAK